MDYKNTRAALSNMSLWEDNPGTDDSQIERLMRIERGDITADEAVQEILNGISR